MKKNLVRFLAAAILFALFLLPTTRAQAAGEFWKEEGDGYWYLCDQKLLDWPDTDDGQWRWIDDAYYHCLSGWQKVGGSWYYFSPDTGFTMATGRWEIGGKTYWFADSGKMKTGWIKEDLGEGSVFWFYAKSDGSLVGGWQQIGTKWYYFDPDGLWMERDGLRTIGPSAYYFDTSGAMCTGWIKQFHDYGEDSWTEWFYAKSSGVLASGWQKLSGSWYYFMPEYFYMVDGISEEIGSKVYVFENGGKLASKAGWLQNAEGWFYVRSDGTPVTGWKTISGKRYYFHEHWGYMLTYARMIGDRLYDFDKNGGYKTVTKNGWNKLDGSWFYVESGKPVSGWKKISSKWYHFDTKCGWMDVGVTEIGGKKYFLGSDGVLASKAGWQKIVNEDYTDWYYTDSDGVCKTGWQKIGGNWYYFEPDFAYMCTGYWDIGGEEYYFDDNGVWVKNAG